MTQPYLHIRNIVNAILCIAVFASFPSNLSAQQRKQSKKVDIPKPERLLLTTKDQVEMRAEWFAGTNGKESVPVILVHDWDSNRRSLTSLATFLQKKGYAVIVPDLRGHGESLTVKGVEKELERARFKKNEMASIELDIDTCRKFLQEKNNEGELNLDLLAVVAFGKMSIPAVSWCISDWKWPPIKGIKQGQNVKALMMISPYKRFKSLSMTQNLKNPLFASPDSALPLIVAYGADHEASAKDSESIIKSLKKYRKEPENFADADERWKMQSLFQIYYNSNLDSEELYKENERDLANAIVTVIENKIVANQSDFPWQSREIK